MGLADDLEQERRTLLEEHAALETEHSRLQLAPYDLAAHRAHTDRLHDHQQRLHTFIERLRSSQRAPH